MVTFGTAGSVHLGFAVLHGPFAGSFYESHKKRIVSVQILHMKGKPELHGNQCKHNGHNRNLPPARTWQGKAMFPNLMIPALFLWLLFMAKDEMDAIHRYSTAAATIIVIILPPP